MSVAIGIVAHTQRRTYADQLFAQVGADFVSLDDDVRALGCDKNHAATWAELAALNTTDWCCVLEDDVKAVINFRGQLDKIMATPPPSPIVSLYLGRQRPPQFQARIGDAIDKAHANDACFVLADRLFSAQGVLLRTELVTDMLAGLKPYLPIDEAISRWARRHHLKVAHTVPSIIEHLDLPTLVRHRDGRPRPPGRVAWTVGTRAQWTPESVNL